MKNMDLKTNNLVHIIFFTFLMQLLLRYKSSAIDYRRSTSILNYQKNNNKLAWYHAQNIV